MTRAKKLLYNLNKQYTEFKIPFQTSLNTRTVLQTEQRFCSLGLSVCPKLPF